MPRIDDVFERVLVVNLDRRADRLANLAEQLRLLGVRFERISAVDGQDQEVAAEWRAHADRPPAQLPPEARPVTNWREFYLDYDSELARTAFFEAQRGCAIATPGAWGLLRSMTAVLERVLAEGWQSVLVLEDDALFHKSTLELFERCVAQLPPDWQIVQLGAMQLHWESDWISWYSDNLYQCRGSSIGAHAFGLCADVIPELLECTRGCHLPFDIGALHTTKRRHAARCFTMFPNLAIQDAADSEIGMSTMFFREARRADNIYRWHLPDYGLAALRAQRAEASSLTSVDPSGAAPALPAPRIPLSDGPRTILARIGRHVMPRPWQSQATAAKAEGVNPARTAAGKSVAPARPLGGQPPLKVRSLKKPKANTIIVLVVGLERDALIRVLDLLRAQRESSDVEPVLLTDCDAFELFRDRRLAFEYLPAPALRERFASQLDWDLYVLRRLALWRRKWQPVRIVSFGPAAAQLVAQWKESLFEDDSIHRVAVGAATIDHSDSAIP